MGTVRIKSKSYKRGHRKGFLEATNNPGYWFEDRKTAKSFAAKAGGRQRIHKVSTPFTFDKTRVKYIVSKTGDG